MRKCALFFSLLCLLTLSASRLEAVVDLEKKHDYLPRFHNIIFLFDVSDSMIGGYPKNYDLQKLFVASRALALFNSVAPQSPPWQYDTNAALITYGDCPSPRILIPLGPWSPAKFEPVYGHLRDYRTGPFRTAGLPEALQLAGSMAIAASGRTAVVIFSDGGDQGECPQRMAEALKKELCDRIEVYSIFFGEMEVGWRNLYEVCKLTNGYARHWEEVRSKPQMKDFVWEVMVREIMFPYPEIFFQEKSWELLPSEALKLESVANFMMAIPEYNLQIDGHTTFFGRPEANKELAAKRATVVRDALVSMFHIHPTRIQLRSWGEDLPRYDNQNPQHAAKNDEANLFLTLPLRNFPYNEKHLHTFGVSAVGDIDNNIERQGDEEWASPANPVPWPSTLAPGGPRDPRRRHAPNTPMPPRR